MRTFLKKISSEKVKKIYRAMRSFLIRTVMLVFRMFPVNKNKVVFTNVWGFADSPKYIANSILESINNKKNDDFSNIAQNDNDEIKKNKKPRLYFISNKSGLKFVPKGIIPCKNNSIKALFALSTAKIWVECNHKEPYISKRKKQYYIQCWHGPIALKKIEWDCANYLEEKYLQNVIRDSSMTDLFVSNSSFATDMYKRAFKYGGQIIECGTPRLDNLVNPSFERIQKIKNKLGVSESTKIAIYAPTYRTTSSKRKGNTDTSTEISQSSHFTSNSEISEESAAFETSNIKSLNHSSTEAYKKEDLCTEYCKEENVGNESLDFKRLLESLEKGYNEEFVLIVRLHPLASNNNDNFFNEAVISKNTKSQRIIDGNKYPDLYELLEATDVLITDYSNTMFEFGYINKPVYLFAPDIKEYESERGLYFDYEKLPFSKSYTKEALYQNLSTKCADKYLQQAASFLNNLGVNELGNASETVARKIFENLS